MAQATLNTDVNARTGASANAPGIQMKQKGSVKGTTGASGYAPGHLKSDTNVGGDVKVRAR